MKSPSFDDQLRMDIIRQGDDDKPDMPPVEYRTYDQKRARVLEKFGTFRALAAIVKLQPETVSNALRKCSSNSVALIRELAKIGVMVDKADQTDHKWRQKVMGKRSI